jgi:cell division protease FtsH
MRFWQRLRRSGRRQWAAWLALGLVLSAVAFGTRLAGVPAANEVPVNELRQLIRDGRIKRITIVGDVFRLELNDGTRRMARNERGLGAFETLGFRYDQPDQSYLARLRSIEYVVEEPNRFGSLVAILSSVLPLVLIGAFVLLMMRQAQGGANQALSFGRSRARLMTGDTPTVTFDDVAGVEEAKAELAEIVEFLREPEKFIALGARIPKGVLMVGPPGCGKTLMARAIAGEAGVPFFSISGSEFVEMFVGVGASRVRDLFEQAKRHSPCIVFIDEIDAVGRHRGAGLGGSHDEREQTLNQILVEMDGFDTDTNVIIVAATNRPDILDPALLRPGRFDRRVVIDRPDIRGRLAILKIHTRGKPLAGDVDLEIVARRTPGFSGADIENLVNEAAILAARRNGRAIRLSDLEDAVDKVMLGPERKSRVISKAELRVKAYHEAGHALTMHLMPECDSVHKVTIIPRGATGGAAVGLPKEDRYLVTRAKFDDDLAAALGGRVAEELVIGDVTTGAKADLEYVTKTARDMVTRYGMSDELGPVTFGEKDELVFLGREIGEQRNYSEAIAEVIDREVRGIVARAHRRTRELLLANLSLLHFIANRLLEVETIEGDEFLRLVAEGRSALAAA